MTESGPLSPREAIEELLPTGVTLVAFVPAHAGLNSTVRLIATPTVALIGCAIVGTETSQVSKGVTTLLFSLCVIVLLLSIRNRVLAVTVNGLNVFASGRSGNNRLTPTQLLYSVGDDWQVTTRTLGGWTRVRAGDEYLWVGRNSIAVLRPYHDG